MTPQLPTATVTRITLDAPYQDFWLEVYDDVEMGVFEDMVSGELGRIFAALAQIVSASNAVDRKGEPADLSTPEGWRRQRRTFVAATTKKIKEAWEHPLGSSSASPTLSP